MLLLLLVVTIVKTHSSLAGSSEEPSVHERNNHVHHVFNTYLTPLVKMNSSHLNFYDEGENMLRIPHIQNMDHHKVKRKPPKKAPKRVIQKIIKKSKAKQRKAYLNQFTSTTQLPQKDEKPEEDKLMKSESTTQPTQKKKPKKWAPKRARLPIPFQKLKKDTAHRRFRREANRSDVYIIQDLDEVQFLGQDDGNNDIVEAHIKKYW